MATRLLKVTPVSYFYLKLLLRLAGYEVGLGSASKLFSREVAFYFEGGILSFTELKPE